MNSLYGYRTPQSLKNEKNWQFANKLWPKILLKYSLIILGIQLTTIVFFGYIISVFLTIILWIIILFLSIILTENKLKKIR
ncbi:SdpI family protein [Aquimarina sp. 2-A2]|uniref:SdpI family protein n=1 Tax=Aquimarina sp. 2-A2 TaxID=3382644 RepID=UPI00387EEE46